MADALHCDIETFSELDLKKVGSHVYFAHPSTKVLCAAWALNDGPIHSWDCRSRYSLAVAIADSQGPRQHHWHAWNAGGFEALAHDQIGMQELPITVWRDTMIRAAYYGLPMSLDQAAQALQLDASKDMAGRRLMLKMSKPHPKGGDPWHVREPELLDQLVAYCKQDVLVEREVGRHLPPLPDFMEESFRRDWRMMQRGVLADMNAIRALATEAGWSFAGQNSELSRIMGIGKHVTVNQTAAILNWINKRCPNLLSSLDKEAVAAGLKYPGLPADVRRVLEIRQEAAKSSVAKLQAMSASAGSDDRIRGLTQFYGASRTGRWAGRLVQVQNLPRPAKGIDPSKEILRMKEAFTHGTDYEPPPGHTSLSTISSCLRGCFVAPADKTLVVGDFSQIEARVVAWLAGQQDILDVFASGQDVYTYTAAKQGSKDRQFGKVLVLACGFGMGGNKFMDTAATYGIDLSLEGASSAVSDWRANNPKIVAFWRQLAAAARAVLEGNTDIVRVGKVKVAMGSNKLAGCLLIQLPSGRVLVYRNARLVPGDPGWPDQIVYDGVNQTTRKWETVTTYGGKLAENVTQAVARDLLDYALEQLSGFNTLLTPLVTVHDEVICEADVSSPGDHAATMHKHMTRTPPWAAGLPVGAECKIMTRYGK